MASLVRFLSLVAATALVAGCGGKDDSSSGAQATPSASTAAAEPAAPAAPAAAAAPAADNVDTVDGTKLASFTADAVHGKAVFAQCMTCHVRDPGVNRIGPSLAGVVGRKAGEVAGFAYSAANKDSGITWTADKLFQYLEKPSRVVPGTKMSFAGLSSGQDRADVIAYLQSPAS